MRLVGVSGRTVGVAATTVLAVSALAACSDGREAAAERVAGAFVSGISAGDFAASCQLLAPATRQRVERIGRCPDVLAGARLPVTADARPGPMSAQVWGEQAQVRTAADTLFLNWTTGGWKVAAAGCQPWGDAPYDCALEGP